jgi:hypothetical protein
LSSGNDTIYTPNSKPYGKSFNDWAVEWTKWALSIPIKHNPASDLSGYNCAQKQSGEVWFLAGTFGGFARRRCYVPEGKAIFFPIITKECSFKEDYDLKTVDELCKRVKHFIDCVTRLMLTIDGIKVKRLRQYRYHSADFDLVFPKDNVYDLKPGPTVSVIDGYWAFLRPLPMGKHLIHFKGEAVLPSKSRIAELAKRYNKIKDTVFITEVLYEIGIVRNV